MNTSGTTVTTLDPTIMSEAEMREFFEKIASTVVNASTLAKQVEEMNWRLNALEAVGESLRQTISAMHETVKQTSQERDDARNMAAVLSNTVLARDARVSELEDNLRERGHTIFTHETTIHELHAKIAELESANRGAQQTIVDLQHTVYNETNKRQELYSTLTETREDRDRLDNTRRSLEGELADSKALCEHYETQLAAVRHALA